MQYHAEKRSRLSLLETNGYVAVSKMEKIFNTE